MAHREQTEQIIVQYINDNPQIINLFLSSYDQPDIAANMGNMFKEFA
jgi:hypothetical protein